MKTLSSSDLLTRAKSLAADERRTTLALIEILAEIDQRRLYADLGFASLWEYATQELGLSEGAAQRRIQAARLLRDVPEARESLQTGSLSLSNAARVQSFRQSEKKMGRRIDARQLVRSVQSLSQWQCESTLLALSPTTPPRESERIVSADQSRELKIVVSAELYEKLERIKGLIAHARPQATYAEVLEYLADAQLRKLEREKGLPSTLAVGSTKGDVGGSGEVVSAQSERRVQGTAEPIASASIINGERATLGLKTHSTSVPIAAAAAVDIPARLPPPGIRGYLPVAVKRSVWKQSGGRCEYVAHGRRCSSRHFLQIDHRVPLAAGGSNEFENFRLLCRNHNLQQSERYLGKRRVK